MARHRNDTVCGALRQDGTRCTAQRHRVCKDCGTGNLINKYGFLVDHITDEIHECDGEQPTRPVQRPTVYTQPVPATPSVMRHDSLAETIANAVRDHVLTDSDIENRISDIANRIVTQAVDGLEIERQTVNVTVTRVNGVTYDAGSQHAEFGRLCRWIQSGVNVLMVGDTGTGKTHSAEQAAKALGIAYYPYSVGPTTQAFDLVGYNSASGEYVPGIAYRPFTEGGLLLLDEMDAASPEALVALNAMLANGSYSFPNGVQQRHPDFRVIAAANTYGTGATREYVGRQQLDAATLPRFTYLDWDYDLGLEQAIINGWCDAYPDYAEALRQWGFRVHTVRRIIREHSIRQSASTRDIIEGSKLIVIGEDIEHVSYARLWARMGNDAKRIKDLL